MPECQIDDQIIQKECQIEYRIVNMYNIHIYIYIYTYKCKSTTKKTFQMLCPREPVRRVAGPLRHHARQDPPGRMGDIISSQGSCESCNVVAWFSR